MQKQKIFISIKKNTGFAIIWITASIIFSPKMLVAQSPVKKWEIKSPFEQKVFIENKGQCYLENKATSLDILFGAKQGGLHYFFTRNTIWIKHNVQIKCTEKESEAEMERPGLKEEKSGETGEKKFAFKTVEQFYQINFIGAGTETEIQAQNEVPGTYNFGTQTNQTIVAHAYKKIVYKNLYPGIDMEFYFPEDKQGFKYNFIIHPGADSKQIQMQFPLNEKIKLNTEGNLIIKSVFGEFTDHAPTANEINKPKQIDCSFKLNKKEIVSFNIGNYDINQELIIDPWTVVPAFTTGNNNVFDVDYDNAGNFYAYGGGSTGQFELIKYNSAGVQQWIFQGFFNVFTTGQYGDFAVDRRTGSCYLVSGTSNIGIYIIKINAAGTQITTSGPGTNFTEFWRIAFSSTTNQLVIGGGGVPAPAQYAAATMDTSLTTLSPVNVLNSPSGTHDVWGLALDFQNNCYMGIAKSASVDPGNFINVMLKAPIVGLSPTSWIVNSGYLFNEVSSVNYYPVGSAGNGFNGMAVDTTNLYTYDSYVLKKWNTANGASLGTVNVNGASAATMAYGGIALDGCSDIYLGVNNTIKQYSSALALVGTTATMSGNIYDIVINNNNLLVVGGNGFIATMNIGCAIVLPIELLNFNTQCINDKTKITWSTLTELNNNYFTLEKSFDGINFETITTIKGAGNSTIPKQYEYFDHSFQNSYYRLKQTDYNGISNTFKIIASTCNVENEFSLIGIQPNPTNSVINIIYNIGKEDHVQLKVKDAIGRELINREIYSNSGINNLEVDLRNYNDGIYFVELSTINKSFFKKVIKNN